MPGISLDETVGCANPLLQFIYQVDGVLTDVAELKFTVQDIKNEVEKVAETVINTDLCADSGNKLGTGRYAAPFIPVSTGASKWFAGTHEIRWSYKPTATDDWQTWKQRFEILDKDIFVSGRGFHNYIDTSELLENSAFYNCKVGQLQEAMQIVAEQIEDLTGRIFEPTYIDTKYNGTNAGALPLFHPIIGIEAVELYSGNELYQSIELTALVFYNRHLNGLKSPDDRDNPRIEFVSSDVSDVTISSTQTHFVLGRQNIRVAGVFGYTEPDGSPIGARPRRLTRAAGTLILRQINDPLGVDVFTSQPGRIRSARTRDQAVTFASAQDGGIGPLTGDRIVDDILLAYMRPPYFGAVPEADRSAML